MTFPAPSPPYRGPAAHTSGGGNKPIHRIVLHSTVSPCEPGGAEAIARYFRSPSAGGSAHYVVDPTTTVQVVYDSVIAWHAPPNANSIGIEMCDMPTTANADRWNDVHHRAMMHRAATLVAELCLAYDVPPWFVGVTRLRAGAHGVTTHNNVSQAFHQSTHWDPGAWPRIRFMRMVRAEVKRLKKGGAPTPNPKPGPEPVPAPQPKPVDHKPQRVRVATYNAGDGPNPAKQRDLLELGQVADVLMLSEFGDRGTVHPAPGMLRFKGEGKPGQPATPIDYRPGMLGKITTATMLLSKAAKVPSKVPGPVDTKPKWGHQVAGTLVDAGMPVRFVSYHGAVTPNATKAGEALGHEQIANLATLTKWAHGRGEVVVLGGDFNRNPDDADLKPLMAAGLHRVSTGPTHGKNTYDQIWVTVKPASGSVVPVSSTVVRDTSSDHDSPIVNLEFVPEGQE